MVVVVLPACRGGVNFLQLLYHWSLLSLKDAWAPQLGVEYIDGVNWRSREPAVDESFIMIFDVLFVAVVVAVFLLSFVIVAAQ